jgi:hypothetical protein
VPAPQRTQIENAAITLTLLFGTVWLTVGVLRMPDGGGLGTHAAIPVMAAVPAIVGAGWALAVGRGRRLALGLGMGLALGVVVTFQLTPLTFVTPLAVLLLVTADATHRHGPTVS